ncbi:MAG: FKBP-type peptidyl-prolyl cis-trans isomerase [Bacteroidota bacterium]
MKKIAILVLTCVIASVSAQEKAKSQKVNNPKTMKTASGLEYTITEKGNGKKPANGDKVIVHYTGKLTNDTVFDSSVKRGSPFSFKLGAGQVIKGWDEAFLLLQVGDKATIKFGPELGYGERGTGPIPANSTLIFDVELLDVIETVKVTSWDVKGKDTVSLPSGLKYIVVKENKKEEKAVTGSKVTLHYSGYFTDGKLFDSSLERGQPFSVKLGAGQIIQALEEGMTLMHKGDKVKFLIPYQLAYGEHGHPPTIPAKADLVFDIELLDIQAVPVPVKYDVTGKEMKTTASGLKYYEIVKTNNPVQAASGKTVKVHYSGYLADGSMFDSSVERGEPIEFVLGQAQVIAGWDEGISLMHVGDKLRLVIPYYLAYGENGRAPMIPPKAELTFDVELVDAK